MPGSTRAHILETGAGLVRRGGFNNTGLNTILKAADVPKGSFYHYFDSKEDFGLELIEYMRKGLSRQFSSYLVDDETTPPLHRLKGFFEYFRRTFSGESVKSGCPIGNLSQELAASYPEFREKLAEVFGDIYEPVRICLDMAVKDGSLRQCDDTHDLARFIVNSWQGAVLALKVVNTEEPLVLFERYVIDQLFTGGFPSRQ